MWTTLRWVSRTLAWLVIGSASAALVVAVVVPRLAGATPYTVLSGSMEPEMPPGSLVVVKPVEAEDVAVGSVITYQLESGQPDVVTHRVTAKGYDGAGVVSLQTKGDANNVPDENWVRPEQIRGEEWYALPYLGYVNSVLTGRQHQYAAYGVATLLLGYAAVMLIGAVRDRRKRRPAEKEEHHATTYASSTAQWPRSRAA